MGISVSDIVGIYIIRNTVDGSLYVGSSAHVRQRWKEHRQHLNAATHSSRHLQNAWSLYGEAAFSFEILVSCDVRLRLWFEQRAINHFMSLGRDRLYNIAPVAGSRLGAKHTPETIAKMRSAHLGKKASAETRARQSIASMGRQRSPASIEKTAAAHRGMKRSAEACAKMSAAGRGKVISTEQRRRQSLATKGRQHTSQHKAAIAAAIVARKERKRCLLHSS